jgi:hypothetical protein
METTLETPSTRSYQRAINASKKARWTIAEVLGERSLVGDYKFLPDGLSLVAALDFLTESERRFMSRVQGRTYTNIFGLVERYINIKVLELAQSHGYDDQIAVEALVRFSEEELKHQELFRQVEQLCADVMPSGYQFTAAPNEVAQAVLSKSQWAVLGLTCHIELFTLAHYKHSIENDPALAPLWKDVFLHHFKEESQHAVLDELEWLLEDTRVTAEQRERGVDDLIALVGAVDGILQLQAAADTDYFISAISRQLSQAELEAVGMLFLKAYRYQYIVSGLQMTRFPEVLFGLVTPAQRQRIETALAPLL